MWKLLNVEYLVVEGLGSQSFIEWCKVSGKTLKMTLYLLLLQDRFRGFEVKKKQVP